MTDYAQLEQSIDIAAPPARVWDLLADLPAMSKRSPQVVRTKVLGAMREGARFVSLNTNGKLFWPTTGKVVRFDPHADLAFRIYENGVVWSFALEATGSGDTQGTRVVHKREIPAGISAVSRALTKVAFGGQENFSDELDQGMVETLVHLKAEAEA